MKFVKIVLALIVWTFSSSTPAVADTNDEQQAYLQVKRATDDILAILVDPEQSKNTKSDAIFSIANDLIDFDLMAKLSIGKSGWKELNPKQKKEYIGLFIKRIRSLYLKTMFSYSQQEIIVEKAEQYKPKRIAVSTYIINDSDKIELLYKFYLSDENKWRAYDIRVDGISIVQTQRSQFMEMLNACTIDDFLEKLRQDDDLKRNNESKR